MSKADTTPDKLTIIAGKGSYPLLLAESAREQGVKRISAVAFKRETHADIVNAVDEVRWVHLGQLARMLDALTSLGTPQVVMAGQITPTHLFRVRMDVRLLQLLRRLPEWNAHSIFGAICDEIRAAGMELLPASSFMQKHMPGAGLLTRRAPSQREYEDIKLGFHIAKTISGLDIGQTVIIKDGTVLAVEAFEGTDDAIIRAGRLGGPGATIVKVAKPGHDMRFDIPVIGLNTIKSIRKAGVSAVALEAGKAILLERQAVIERLDRLKVALQVMELDDEG